MQQQATFDFEAGDLVAVGGKVTLLPIPDPYVVPFCLGNFINVNDQRRWDEKSSIKKYKQLREERLTNLSKQ